MRALVTGGTGFIGSALVRRLVREGHDVRVLDNNLRGRATRLAGIADRITLICGDARESDVVCEAARNCDIIWHLAALNGTENFYRQPELVLDIGVRSMLAVIDACERAKVRQLIVASSAEAYQSPPIFPTPETVPLVVPDVLNARYSYGASKLISEVLTINYARAHLQRAVIFRPHNVYGADMGWEHVIPQFALRALDQIAKHPKGDLPFPIQGDGNQTRAFVHIDDLVEGMMMLFERGRHLEIYNIGTEDELSIRNLAEKVAAVFGRKIRLEFGPPAEGGTERRCPAIGKIRALGYQPQIAIDKGVRDVVEWYAANVDSRPAPV